MMHSTNAVLDGVSNGIGAYIRSRNGWLKRSDGKTNLFTNFKSLEARLFREKLDYHDVAFCFIIQDPVVGKATISLNDAIKTDTGWKVSRWETIYGQQFLHIYDISEIEHEQTTVIGYISSNEAGTHDPNKDPAYEYGKLKKLRHMAYDAVYDLAKFPVYGISVEKSKQGLEVKLDNTSAIIHIWINSKLMDYNTAVKKLREESSENNTRCLPYTKDMDKYGTLYIFATCDESDVNDSYTNTEVEKLISELIALMQENNPKADVKYISCQYNGKVLLNHSIIKEG